VTQEKTSSSQTSLLPGIIGTSQAMREVTDQVYLIAETDVTCLLTGETGTGKELFARAIHYLSARKKRPFVPVNCGAIPDHLFENEVFGHVRGAYTDARSNARGLLAFAEGGTLFLDEVDSLSASAQVKLLRVLQEREYRPVGSVLTIPANIRIVAAANNNLYGAVQARRFREDLYFRLNILSIAIPPLRDRREDIAALSSHYIREYTSIYNRTAVTIEACALDRLVSYHWPGNVRELQAVLHRSVLRARDGSIGVSALDLPGGTVPRQEYTTLKAAKEAAVAQCERSYISTVLGRCGGNITQAAKMAGKERRSFQRLLRKHSIPVVPFRNIQEAV